MLQTGTVGNSTIGAWAIRSIAECKVDMPWSPRISLRGRRGVGRLASA